MNVDTKGVSMLIPREYQCWYQGSINGDTKGVSCTMPRECCGKYQGSTGKSHSVLKGTWRV